MMLEDVYNVEKIHRINFFIIIIICSINFLQILIIHSQNYGIDLIKPLVVLFMTLIVFFIKIHYYQIKAILLSLLPSVIVFYLFTQTSFSVNKNYLLLISLIMASMYFNYKVIIIYALIQDALIVAILFLNPSNFIGSSSHNYDQISAYILFNVMALVIGIMTKWGNSIMNKSTNSYLELSALYGEVADRDREIKTKSNELILKEEKIGSLYNQVAASEEELKWQYSTIEEKQRQIKHNEEIFRAISETSNDGIWYLDIKQGKKTYSQNWCEVLGFTQAELTNIEDFQKLIHPEDANVIENAYKDHIDKQTDRYKCQYRVKTKSETYIWVDEVGKVLSNSEGEPILVVGANSDITKTREQNEKIEYLAYHDVLTALPNRILFYDRLTMSINEHNRKNERLGIILMDLDNFKMINDGFSHSFGDEVLKIISERLTTIVRESDTLARVGGDGFAVLLNDIKDYSDIVKLSDRITKVLNEPIRISEQEIDIRCSMGFAVYPMDGENYEELLKSADTALCKAKTSGKNCCQFYNGTMKSDILNKIEIEKKIKDGIKNKEFVLYFQPQIDIRNNKIRGFEALVRWIKGKELIPPNKFIPIAEETGLIVELGEWILMEACCKNREWERLYNTDVIISVNISVIQLNHRSFVQYVKKVLEVSGMKPECLELEITESMFIGSFEESVSKLNELRQLGIKIALDDFGTGYSSLNYLQNLPIDTLKIDKTFIDGISNLDKSKDIVGAIINLIQSLGLNTIAEGVETKEQLKYLTQNGCENVQGYIFSRPVPEKEAVNKLFEDYSDYAI